MLTRGWRKSTYTGLLLNYNRNCPKNGNLA